MNDDLESIWKKAVAAQIKVLPQHLTGGTEENWKACQNNRSPGRNLNPGPPEYDLSVDSTIILKATLIK
jgi:hypothetical protein